ncbi:exodeoxyribonuclease VII large subunit [uncultured Duncaniella sp.]|uniref:exodeoxyribonuclease VII large subunit n=1 Tax=uncultured Duncaniella sp. TaxID=2768039 RepID=UPI00260E4687|nr:exodeoxyribonuclease VII large subunit [uncultured Duncaniella sp.]
MTPTAITLEEFTSRISAAVNGVPGLAGVWVVAETSDLRRSGHCYLELVQKHPVTGDPVARMRATIWRSALARIDSAFTLATGQQLASGMKVMVRVTASFHPAYGLSANITEIDPSYTLGDLMRRRQEIIARLRAEGIIDLNRELEWPDVPLRIAVISAPGAAGYGDFIHQLYTSPSRLDFRVRLFPALMQGASAPSAIIAALEQIAGEDEEWDCVVIIRGGGATSDLAAFDNYDLAANIAQFPLPVIIGIGHERDITVLDSVANMRVKTPTAAAEWLIARGEDALATLERLGSTICMLASDIIAGSKEQMARLEATLSRLPQAALALAGKQLDRLALAVGDAATASLRPERARLDSLTLAVSDAATACLRPERSRLDIMAERLSASAFTAIERQRTALDTLDGLVKVLSPQSTLARGYSITRVNGRAVTSAEGLAPGTTLETTLASGTVLSVTKEI